MPKRRRSREFKNNRVIDIEIARQERRERRKQSAESRSGKEKHTSNEPTRRQTVKSIRRRAVYSLVIILLFAVMGVSLFNVITLRMEKAEAEAKLLSLENEKKALQEELSKAGSKEYIEQQAREQLRMIMPGEVLYVLKESEKAEDETTD
ncbi:hypothetical protein MASR2M70_07670 [Bacillota bacterium]